MQGRGCQQLRRITLDERPGSSAELTDQEYHRLSDLTLADLMSRLEPLIEDSGIEEAEVEYSEVSCSWPAATARQLAVLTRCRRRG